MRFNHAACITILGAVIQHVATQTDYPIAVSIWFHRPQSKLIPLLYNCLEEAKPV